MTDLTIAAPPARGGDVPFFDLVDLRVLELGANTARCAITCGPWLDGLGALGIPAEMVALADCALAYAATRVSGEGMGTVSVSLRVDYRSVAPPSIGSVLTSAPTPSRSSWRRGGLVAGPSRKVGGWGPVAGPGRGHLAVITATGLQAVFDPECGC